MRFIFFSFLVMVLFAGCKKEDQRAVDDALIQDHITANSLDAVGTSTGLYYVIDDSGTVDHPTVNNTVMMYYTGKLLDGTQFDAVNSPADPLELPLSWTILGWQEGVPYFGRGGKGKLLIPSHLGYGEDGSGTIPKDAVLVFDVELVDFN